jgi:hypothetical protein
VKYQHAQDGDHPVALFIGLIGITVHFRQTANAVPGSSARFLTYMVIIQWQSI